MEKNLIRFLRHQQSKKDMLCKHRCWIPYLACFPARENPHVHLFPSQCFSFWQGQERNRAGPLHHGKKQTNHYHQLIEFVLDNQNKPITHRGTAALLRVGSQGRECITHGDRHNHGIDARVQAEAKRSSCAFRRTGGGGLPAARAQPS